MKLLLLHGLGGNAHVWDRFVTLATDEVIAPDLASHGQALPLPQYDFERYVADILERFGDQLRGAPLRILGHSLGGATGIALTAIAPALDVRAIVTVGVKTQWSQEDITAMHRVADKGVLWFDSEQAATERFIKVSGLSGLVVPNHRVVQHGIAREDERWRFAADPETFGLSPKALHGYLDKVTCPVLMASGEHDMMASPDSLRHLGCPVVTLDGLGHNAHVQDPAAVLAFFDKLRGAQPRQLA